MTTYTKRTNAKRAAIRAGIPAEQVEITIQKKQGEVRFGYTQKETQVQAPAKPAGSAQRAADAKALAAQQEQRNGVKRPRRGGACALVWAHLDSTGDISLSEIKAWATAKGLNANNAAIEIYGWRRFNSIQR